MPKRRFIITVRESDKNLKASFRVIYSNGAFASHESVWLQNLMKAHEVYKKSGSWSTDWCIQQRELIRRVGVEEILTWRYSVLSALSFGWGKIVREVVNKVWMECFVCLHTFRSENLCWPLVDEKRQISQNTNPKLSLGYWCRQQVFLQSVNCLDEEKVQYLDNIDFPWHYYESPTSAELSAVKTLFTRPDTEKNGLYWATSTMNTLHTLFSKYSRVERLGETQWFKLLRDVANKNETNYVINQAAVNRVGKEKMSFESFVKIVYSDQVENYGLVQVARQITIEALRCGILPQTGACTAVFGD